METEREYNMNPLWIFILIIGIACLIASIMVILINWTTHISMTKQFTSQYGYANYSIFLKEFNKIQNWDTDTYHKNIYKQHKTYRSDTYSIGILQFNNKGMVMATPWDYLMMEWHFMNLKKQEEQQKLINWYSEE